MPRGLAIGCLLALAALAAPGAAAADDVPPWLGISFTSDPRMSMPPIEVVEVYPGTGAALAGVSAGDLIVRVGSDPVFGGSDLLLRRITRNPDGTARPIGAQVAITIERDGRERELTVTLGARLSSGELLEQRLLGAPLPRMALVDRVEDRPVSLAGQAGVLIVFDAACDGCSSAADAVVAAARAADPGLVVRVIVAGERDELGAFLARSPMTGPVLRWEASRVGTRGASVLSGLNGGPMPGVVEGAVLVVDAAGVVQFAATTLDVAGKPEVMAAALIAAARVHERAPRRLAAR